MKRHDSPLSARIITERMAFFMLCLPGRRANRRNAIFIVTLARENC